MQVLRMERYNSGATSKKRQNTKSNGCILALANLVSQSRFKGLGIPICKHRGQATKTKTAITIRGV
jgi:hypothetical protein